MTDQHPALITEDSGLPSLTLVLPGNADQVLTDLALAISKTHQTMAGWVEAFRRRRDECAASGDQLGQAMARGQVVTGEHVIDHLDENIVEVFGLWDQYDAQVPRPGVEQPGAHPLPAGGTDG